MASRKKTEISSHTSTEKEAAIIDQNITETLENNYMPYAMSVIVSRALPEIDGFKPSHRKLLYTMYKMGLLNGGKTKSANIVGQTMKLNPHGDQAIYETMVRLAEANESLLCPYVDSKGNFGKHFSRDMAYAASRYTEAKLTPICTELFSELDKDAVDMVDNYDGTLKEPKLLPVTFPSILINSNMGIAVGMASNICSFNLKEICEATILRIKKPKEDILSIIKGPDFSTGGNYIYNQEEMEKIRDFGKGSLSIRAKYRIDKKAGIIEIYEIPYSTTVENIMEDITSLVKNNKVKEINDIRDETDLKGLKLAIDYKRNCDPEALMTKLFKLTKLQDSFACNFNILINGFPKVLGIRDIIDEWIKWRRTCVVRSLNYDLNKKEHKLMLLQGLEKVSLNINKAIKIIRETENDKDVIPNLMAGFKINEEQAEFIAEIKLRNLNKDYIAQRLKDIVNLEKDISNIKSILASNTKVNGVIVKTLEEIIKKYAEERKTTIISAEDIEVYEEPKEDIPAYAVKMFLTNDGYLKKIPDTAKIDEFKLKTDDKIISEASSFNDGETLIFTNKQNIYKIKINSLKDMKYSDLGEYLPALLDMQSDEIIKGMICTNDFKGNALICFENGKIANIPLSAYETKQNRKKLINSISDASNIINVIGCVEKTNIKLKASNNKSIVFSCNLVPEKTTKNTAGVCVMKLKENETIISAEPFFEEKSKLTILKIPSSGKLEK